MNAGRDRLARLIWLLPHDLRRSLYFRLRPSTGELYESMRTNQLGEIPGLTVSLAEADRLRCIFVHIPKCGGSSIGRALFGTYNGNLMPLASYQMIYSSADFEDFFKFAIVRNPFDRLLSGYHFAKHGSGDVPPVGERTQQVGTLSKPANVDSVELYEDFEHFVTDWVTPANVRLFEHFRPQHRFACSPDGRLGLDYVGRFESIGESFRVVAERLGVEPELPHERRTNTSDATKRYADHYTPAMRRIVERVFARDLQLFDYSFAG